MLLRVNKNKFSLKKKKIMENDFILGVYQYFWALFVKYIRDFFVLISG